jgi:hypothetical protein
LLIGVTAEGVEAILLRRRECRLQRKRVALALGRALREIECITIRGWCSVRKMSVRVRRGIELRRFAGGSLGGIIRLGPRPDDGATLLALHGLADPLRRYP